MAGNPYTSVTVSGYNTSPPSDDASQVSSNQLGWDKHKEKLGDPLKTALELINSRNLTAHARQLGQTFETKSTAYTVQAPGDRGKFFEVTGTTTITLPAAADAGDGFPVVIVNTGSATVTVEGNASELINGSPTVTLSPGLGLIITCDASAWVGLIYNLDFSGLPTIEGNALVATDGFLVDDAGVPKRMRYQDAGLIIPAEVSVTDNKVFTDAEMNQVWKYNNGSDALWDIDTGVGVKGNFLIFVQMGAGSIDWSGGTATINNADSHTFTAIQDSVVVLLCLATDVWVAYGDTAAS